MSDVTIWGPDQPNNVSPIGDTVPSVIPKETMPHVHHISGEYVIVQEPSQTRAILANRGETPEPKRGCEVIVLNIPRNIVMRRIYDYLASCGPIYEIRILMEFSGFNKGVCYVKFLEEKAAKMASLVLDRSEIQSGVKIYIRMSFDNNKLRISNIPREIPAGQVCLDVLKCGGRGLTDIRANHDEHSLSTYQVILEYATHKDALLAKRLIWNGLQPLNFMMSVDWIEPDGNRMVNSSTLYFKNFPENQTRADLFDFLSKTIDIKTVMKIHVEKGSGYIMFFENTFRRAAENVLQAARPSGRKLQLRIKKATPTLTPEYCSNHHGSLPPINENLWNAYSPNIIDYVMVNNMSIFNLPEIVTEPGIYSEQYAINQAILQFISQHYPYVNWTVLESDENGMSPTKQTIKLLLKVNGDEYSFLLAPTQ